LEQRRQLHTYRLKMIDDGRGLPRDIEFEASGAAAALHMTHELCGARKVQLYEDGRKLADVQLSAREGFWMVGGTPVAPSRA
jgi:hypothetical protein